VKHLLRWAVPGGLLAPLLVFVLLLGFVVLIVDADERAAAAQPCGAVGAPVVPVAGAPAVPGGSVAGYSGQQLDHAATIMRAGADLGLSAHGQTVGVMTAMGESSLINVDYGDTVGPDSRGLFQQRANGAWGSYADRMDPYISATNFFRALLRVPGWEALPPTLAAHRTQRNADPWHYEDYWPAATQVVAALGGGIAPVGEPGGGVPCQDTPAVAAPVGAGGWTKPAVGRFTSGFGPRWGAMHQGVDIAGPLGTPIWVAAGGLVVGVCTGNVRPCTGYGSLITVDHGGGVVTRYAHMHASTIRVRVGDSVKAGDQIAGIGNEGGSTGPHLHFEVREGDRFTDPLPFLRERGVDLAGV
jgi:murein DD-endopeptidase MepM/ murein hydrolase activator NlpD